MSYPTTTACTPTASERRGHGAGTYGPAVTEALRQLDRATTLTWKAVNLVEVTDDEWRLVKRVIGIDRGREAAYRLVSALDLPGPPANVPRMARKRAEGTGR